MSSSFVIRGTSTKVISKYFWWIGSALVLLPLIYFSADSQLLPVISYYGTSTIWTVAERVLKAL